MSFPARPSLEQFRKQAKDLRKAHRQADPQAAERIRAKLPRLSQTPAADIPAAEFSLQEAQHVIAREYGFRNWRALQVVAAVEFDLLAGLDDAGAQALLREVDSADCVAALKTATAEVHAKLLGNMSARVRGFVESELVRRADLSDEEARAAQVRILLQAKQCAEAGSLRWPEEGDGRGDASPPAVERPLDDLARCPLDTLAANDLAAMWAGFARLARAEGPSTLETFADAHETSAFVGEALRLAAWGTEPDLIEDVLQTRSQMALIPQQSTRCRMVIEGLMTIAAGDGPGVIRYKLGTFYRADGPENDDGVRAAITIDSLIARLREAPLAEMEIEELADVFVDMGHIAGTARDHVTDLRALRPLIQALSGASDLTSELLRRGLELLLDESAVVHLPRPPDREEGEEAEARRQNAPRLMEQVAATLETQLAVRLAGLERAHRMVVTGVVALVNGDDPARVGSAVRQVAA